MIDTNELLKQFEPKEKNVLIADPQIRNARFSPCGKVLVGGGFDARVRRWNLAADDTPELPALLGHHAWIDAIAFRLADELLFSGDSWGQLACWSNYTAENPAIKWNHEQAHNGWIRDLATSPNGEFVASCGSDQRVKVWSINDGKLLHELANYGRDILHLRFVPDGTLLTGDDRGIVKHWKLSGEMIREFNASGLYKLDRLQDVGGVHALAIDATGERIAVGGTTPANGATITGIPTIIIFNLTTGEQLHKLSLGTAQDCFVADMHFHAAGFLSLVTYGTPGQGQFLYVLPDAEKPFFTGKKLANCQSISWSPDGSQIAIVATNPGSNGNGRPLDKEGNYLSNKSPIHLFTLPAKPMQ